MCGYWQNERFISTRTGNVSFRKVAAKQSNRSLLPVSL